MSTRYLRKAYGTDGIMRINDDDSSDVEAPISESKLFNVFDLVIITIIIIRVCGTVTSHLSQLEYLYSVA